MGCEIPVSFSVCEVGTEDSKGGLGDSKNLYSYTLALFESTTKPLSFPLVCGTKHISRFSVANPGLTVRTHSGAQNTVRETSKQCSCINKTGKGLSPEH